MPEKRRKATGGEEDVLDPQGEMSFMQHLGVLRSHLIRGLIWFLVGGIGAVLTLNRVWDWMLIPLCRVRPNACYVFPRELLEAFTVYLKLGCLLALFYSLPLLLFELWKFVAPGLYRREKRVILPVCLGAGVLFAAGAAFGFWVIFPPLFKTLLGPEVSNPRLHFLVGMDSYFTFSAKMLLSFGMVFETPLAMMLISALGLVRPRWWKRYRKLMYLVLLILAALIAPSTDPVSFLGIGIPMCLLYELGILLARLVFRESGSLEDDQDPAAQAA